VAPQASVVVRAKDEERTIGRVLSLLRSQTVPAEIIVVDSGSTDRTVEIAKGTADRLIEIPEEEFSFGHALNLGAEAASAPFVFALSAHCTPTSSEWIERSLALYQRDDVVATNGATHLADGAPVEGTFYQDGDYARAHPTWGFSNHASSWKRSVWDQCRFDESLDGAEDKEWALRVLAEGGRVIAYRADLMVPLEHRWKNGALAFFRRERMESRVLTRVCSLPPYRARDLAQEWWNELPDDRHSRIAHRFLNYVRIAGLLGKYAGSRDAHTAGRG
jgi:glycosyltransferase involved in cell wall biosynthesis